MPATYRGRDDRRRLVIASRSVDRAAASGAGVAVEPGRASPTTADSGGCGTGAYGSCTSADEARVGCLPDELAITAGGAIFQRLRQLGVDVVLVNSGTDFPPIIEGLAEAETHGIDVPRSIVVPHEHVAMGIAHGYFVASGRAQAVMLHTNVGLANGAIGAINMATDHIPVILMSGRTPTTERGRFGARTVPIGWGQEMRDQAALVREATKWDYEVRFPEQVPELLDRAYAIAMSTPKGPVYLSLPREVLCEPCPAEALDAPITMRAASIVAAPDQLAAAAELLTGAGAAADRRPAGRRLPRRVRGARSHRRAVVDPGVPVLGERHRDLRRAPDVRGSGSGAVGRRGRRDPRDRQPRPMDARRARAAGRMQDRAPRAQSVVQPVPGAELPLRPGDHDRGRRRPRGARTGDARARPGR